jgi:Bardet-Biedl syndrome 2 protein
VFQNEEVISEITETDEVTKLCNIYSSKYGYALANGTIGVYDNTTRVWRSKTKYRVTSIEGLDF